MHTFILGYWSHNGHSGQYYLYGIRALQNVDGKKIIFHLKSWRLKSVTLNKCFDGKLPVLMMSLLIKNVLILIISSYLRFFKLYIKR